jgi:serine/threonine-protein kinase
VGVLKLDRFDGRTPRRAPTSDDDGPAERPGSGNTGLMPGARLDRYDLLMLVAEGGMAQLWLARQRGKYGFDRVVAIKTILPRFATERGFRRMFLDEARTASCVSHVNVARVVDLGEEEGVLFIVMEWIDGESLTTLGRHAIKEPAAGLPPDLVARIATDACLGLHAAHTAVGPDGRPLDIVHRDVSPQNLLVGFDGITRVIDFGIAKARNRLARDTSAGMVKGKTAYMAPEQALARGVDRRTDIWGVGATMYRYLVGKPPYGTNDAVSTLGAIMSNRAPLPLPENVPAPLRKVVERALQLDRADRFQTAAEMATALTTAVGEMGTPASHDDISKLMFQLLGPAREGRVQALEQGVRDSRVRQRVHPPRETDALLAPALIHQGVPGGMRAALPLPPPELLTSISISETEPPASAPPTELEPAPGTMASEPPTTVTSDRPSLPVPLRRVKTRSWRRLRRAPVVALGLLAAALCAGWCLHPPSDRVAEQGVAAVRGTATAVEVVTTTPVATAPAVSIEPIATPTPAGPAAGGPGPVVVSSLGAAPAPTPAPVASTAAPSVRSLLQRGRAALRSGNTPAAREAFEAAVARAPSDCEALTALAGVDQAAGSLAQAHREYERALQANEGYLPARLGLADVEWAQGRRDEARGRYLAIVDAYPHDMLPARAVDRAGIAPAVARP